MNLNVGILQPPFPGPANRVKPADVTEFIFHELNHVKGKCDLIVLPEYANCAGIENKEELYRTAERNAQSFIEKLSRLAGEKNSHLAVNMLLKKAGRYFNTTLLISPEEKILAEYAKTHLTRTEVETLNVTPGTCPVLVEVNGIRITFATCFEIYFVEYMERLASLAPDLLIFPTYQRSEDSEVIRKQTMGRALDLEAFILRASYSMGKESPTGGSSMVVTPKGKILFDAGQDTGFFTCAIDPAEKRLRPTAHGLTKARSREIVEEFRKPQLYRPAGPDAKII